MKSLALEGRLQEISDLDRELFGHFKDKLVYSEELSRSLVSFQSSKAKPLYRWYKYKEAFSADLVHYLFEKYGLSRGKVLDPFAGSGTTLFAASERGLEADGIELLSIGQELIETRKIIENELTNEDLSRLQDWANTCPWETSDDRGELLELPITKGAYPPENIESIERYLGRSRLEGDRVRSILQFALLCILESISYTRKDGQYLRWDYRSGRQAGKIKFDKGEILQFTPAIRHKLQDILEDLEPNCQQLEIFSSKYSQGKINLYQGSCLDILPELERENYNCILTSPPYCNRYDYTRIYALELALLGVNESELKQLRQRMLSCTVENRPKNLPEIDRDWMNTIDIANNQRLLQVVLAYLEGLREQKTINNNGIPRMVKGYFYEMACTIYECYRVLKEGGLLFMVNDNVRYAGASVSVDLILSKIAEEIGFSIENILVLPKGKGNSSQQMGVHGREALRKCIYVWRKPKL